MQTKTTQPIRSTAVLLLALQAFAVFAAATAFSSSAAEAGPCIYGRRSCYGYEGPPLAPRPDKPNQQKK